MYALNVFGGNLALVRLVAPVKAERLSVPELERLQVACARRGLDPERVVAAHAVGQGDPEVDLLALVALVERFDIESYSDFSAK